MSRVVLEVNCDENVLQIGVVEQGAQCRLIHIPYMESLGTTGDGFPLQGLAFKRRRATHTHTHPFFPAIHPCHPHSFLFRWECLGWLDGLSGPKLNATTSGKTAVSHDESAGPQHSATHSDHFSVDRSISACCLCTGQAPACSSPVCLHRTGRRRSFTGSQDLVLHWSTI